MWIKIPLVIAAAYIGICLLLYFAQRKLIYLPSRGATELPGGFVEWRLPGSGEYSGYKRVRGSEWCLFFFHGNGGNASGWSHAVAEFPGDIFVLEYPGYGKRSGAPSEESIKQAALKGFDAEHSNYTNIVVAGQSLGAGVTEAVFSAHPQKVTRLLLITPFTSIADVARTQFPWVPTSLILKDRFELIEPWRKFGGKTCVVLAGRDEVIPAEHGQKYLTAKSDVCQIVELSDETHNSISLEREFWETLME